MVSSMWSEDSTKALMSNASIEVVSRCPSAIVAPLWQPVLFCLKTLARQSQLVQQ
eukprot:COSAG03_NODE_1886_length_3391_cov_1.808931_3_plen_55_part_00